MKRLASFGFALSPWQTVTTSRVPSIGKFEGDRFDPRTWRPQTPTAAYMELRDDDAFWAAQRVAAFSDEMIRAIVHTGQFSDPAAEKAISATSLIKRRDKILAAYLPAVNPIVGLRLENDRLTFENAAVAAHVAKPPASYRAAWSQFDNATGETRPIGETTSTTTTITAPAGLPSGANSFIAVNVSAESPEHAAVARSRCRHTSVAPPAAGSWSGSSARRRSTTPFLGERIGSTSTWRGREDSGHVNTMRPSLSPRRLPIP